jgi:mediator of RNA polymerase II transcription subunit 13
MNRGLLHAALSHQQSQGNSSGASPAFPPSNPPQVKGIPVILSPYGLSGTLTGQSFKESDPQVQKFLSDWKKFYPLNNQGKESNGNSDVPSGQPSSSSSSNKSSNTGLESDAKAPCPSVVEVIVAGMRMKYPSSYTFHVPYSHSSSMIAAEGQDLNGKSHSNSTSIEANIINNHSNIPGHAFLTPPNSPEDASQVKLKTPVMSPRQPVKPTVERLVRSSTEQSVSLAVKKATESADQSTETSPLKIVDFSKEFQDTAHRPNCGCHRCKSPKKSNQTSSGNNSNSSLNNSSSSVVKGGKESSPKNKDKSSSSKSSPMISDNKKPSGPFHKRNLLTANRRTPEPTQNNNSSVDVKEEMKHPATPMSVQQPKTPGMLSYKSPCPGGLASIQSNMSSSVGGIDSPKSAAPSSVMNGDDPGSVGPHSMGLPSVSPAPARDHDGMNATESSSFASSISQSPAMQTAMTPLQKEKSQLEQLLSPYPASNSPRVGTSIFHSLRESGPPSNSMVPTPAQEMDTLEARRPVTNTGLLYVFQTPNEEISEWGLPQPKRRRQQPKDYSDDVMNESSVSMSSGINSHRDPYEFSEFDEPHGNNASKVEVTPVSNTGVANGVLTPDEPPNLNSWSSSFIVQGSVGGVADTASKLLMSGLDSITATSPLTPHQFTRQEELKASISDLDKMFEESSGEEESSDGDINPRTLNGKTRTSSNPPTDIDLKKMFPTPPSLEPNAVASPSTAAMEAALLAENPDAPCSPAFLETIRQSTDVYKPPITVKFVAPQKYAPIDLPPPMVLPPECRYRTIPRERPSLPSQGQQQQFLPAPPQNQLAKMLGHTHNIPQSIASGPAGYEHRRPPPNGILPSSSMMAPRMQGPPSVGPSSGFSRGPPNVSIRSPGGPFTPPMAVSSPLQGALTGVMSPFTSGTTRGPGRPHVVNGYHDPVADPRFGSLTKPNASSLIPNPVPEVCSVIVNLALSDSLLNLHKDHNFDSCTICVCNNNIKGADAGVFIPESLIPGIEEPQYKCTCGFSAVVNRRKSQFAGLFYEDEVEITGNHYEPLEVFRKRRGLPLASDGEKQLHGLLGPLTPGELSPASSLLLELVRGQCSYTFSSSSFLFKTVYSELIQRHRRDNMSFTQTNRSNSVQSRTALNDLEPGAIVRSDSCEIAFLSVIQGKSILESFPRIPPAVLRNENRKMIRNSVLHDWQFMSTQIPDNNHETVKFLRGLLPIFQESVQKKPKATWEVTYPVSGPLTWRQFHRLAGRGTEDQCEPQPIPSLLVGYNKEWVAIAPYALKMWSQLLLEPYSTTRDVGYIIVCPDNAFPDTKDKMGQVQRGAAGHLIPKITTFFNDLSHMYELMRLGRHAPLSTKIPALRVGPKYTRMMHDEVVKDEWFSSHNFSPDMMSKLTGYLKVCTGLLTPLIMGECKSNYADYLASNKNTTPGSSSGSSGNPNNPIASSSSSSGQSRLNLGASPSLSSSQADNSESRKDDDEKSSGDGGANQSFASQSEYDLEDELQKKQPAIVIYIVEPFNIAALDREGYRVACAGLLRCFAEVFKSLPDVQNNLNLQLISLDAILESALDGNNSTRQEQLRSLALSVYGQCRKSIAPVSLCKSLTGFGPSASLDLFLKKIKENKGSISSFDGCHSNRFFCPPYILAPLKDKQTELGDMFGDSREKSQVLFCSYCLTEDQRFLIASVSNEKGDIMENTVIYIEVPNRLKRKGATVRKFGLNKLMEFIVQVISETLEPFRLVIGRLGRLGHGELREWASLLSKKALAKQTARMKEKCEQCKSLNHSDLPSILSACLISLEADTSLRVFPDQFTHEDRFKGTICPLETPADASSTHLLIFPTSATMAAGPGNIQGEQANLGDDDLLGALGFAGEDVDMGGDDGMNDLFNWNDGMDLPSPGNEQAGISTADSPSARQSGVDGSGFKVS